LTFFALLPVMKVGQFEILKLLLIKIFELKIHQCQ